MLIAQSAAESSAFEASAFDWTLALAVVVPAFVLIVIFGFIVLLLRHLRFTRDRTHTERLKMIEMGYPLEDSESTKRHQQFMHNAYWISFWMIVTVPASAYSAAATATGRIETGVGYLLAIWIGASAACVATVVCATILMIHSRTRRGDEDEGIRSKKVPNKWRE